MIIPSFHEEIKGVMWGIGEAYYFMPEYKGFRFGERVNYHGYAGLISSLVRIEYRGNQPDYYVIVLTMDNRDRGRGENGYAREISQILNITPSLDYNTCAVNDIDYLEHLSDCYTCIHDCKRRERCEMYE